MDLSYDDGELPLEMLHDALATALPQLLQLVRGPHAPLAKFVPSLCSQNNSFPVEHTQENVCALRMAVFLRAQFVLKFVLTGKLYSGPKRK